MTINETLTSGEILTREQEPKAPISDFESVKESIEGDAQGKNFLSVRQLTESDYYDYFDEAKAAESLNQPGRNRSSRRNTWPVTPGAVMKVVMKQASTRTAGSCTTAVHRLGGAADLISGMESSAEAKGEYPADSWVAFAAQCDIIGTRTKENDGPALAALAIQRSFDDGKLSRRVPVINLGDGTNEHPTQTMEDLYTIHKEFGELRGLTLVTVGDQQRYRAFHSLLLAAGETGMNAMAVESAVSRVPGYIVDTLGHRLKRTFNLDEALPYADVLYPGRKPDEYTDRDNPEEVSRSEQLSLDYLNWKITHDKLQKMPPRGIVMHARPRGPELPVAIDPDSRTRDVRQMENMIPMRMAIIARHLGFSILNRRQGMWLKSLHCLQMLVS